MSFLYRDDYTKGKKSIAPCTFIQAAFCSCAFTVCFFKCRRTFATSAASSIDRILRADRWLNSRQAGGRRRSSSGCARSAARDGNCGSVPGPGFSGACQGLSLTCSCLCWCFVSHGRAGAKPLAAQRQISKIGSFWESRSRGVARLDGVRCKKQVWRLHVQNRSFGSKCTLLKTALATLLRLRRPGHCWDFSATGPLAPLSTPWLERSLRTQGVNKRRTGHFFRRYFQRQERSFGRCDCFIFGTALHALF